MFRFLTKKALAACLFCVAVAFLLGVLRPFSDARARVLAEQRERVQESHRIMEEARHEYCGVFLSYYAACFNKERGACEKLSSVTLEYNDVYGGDPNADCAPSQDAEPETVAQVVTEKESPDDPLFYDGE